MLSRNKTVIAIFLLTVSFLIAVLCLNVTSRVLNRVNDRASGNIVLTPFYSKDVWGAKIETANGSRQLFAGIHRGITTTGEGANDGFTSGSVAATDGKIQNSQHRYKFEFAKFDIILKILSYNHHGPDQEQYDPPPNQELKHLNYIVGNSACRKCSKDDIILLNRKNVSNNHDLDNRRTEKKVSILALVIQIIPQ